MWCNEHIGERFEDLEAAVPGVHALIQLHLPQVGKEKGSCKHCSIQTWQGHLTLGTCRAACERQGAVSMQLYFVDYDKTCGFHRSCSCRMLR